MRSFFAGLSILFISNINAQLEVKCYDPSDVFVFSPDRQRIEIVDSVFPNWHFLGEEEVYGPFDFVKNSQKVYSKQTKFELDPGEKVSFDIYYDSVIVYRHFHVSKLSNTDSLVTFGEMRIDFSKFSTNKILSTSQFGEDSIIYDTVYKLYKTGIWSVQKDFRTFQTGSYFFNQRDGTWLTINSEFNYRFKTPIIDELIYENGIIIRSTKIDLSKDVKHLEKNLTGNWYNTGLSVRDKQECIQNKCSLIFVKDSTRLTPSYFGTYDVLKFNKKNGVQIETSVHCGVGVSKEDLDKTKKWHVFEREFIIIDDQKFKIEYLTEEVLIISHLNF